MKNLKNFQPFVSWIQTCHENENRRRKIHFHFVNMASNQGHKGTLLKDQLHLLQSSSIEQLLGSFAITGKTESEVVVDKQTPRIEESIKVPPLKDDNSSESIEEEEKNPSSKRPAGSKKYLLSPGRYRSLSHSVHEKIFKGLKLEESQAEASNTTSPLGISAPVAFDSNQSDTACFIDDKTDYQIIDPDKGDKCTIRDLVFRLAVEGDPDLLYVDDFLISHRYFMDSEDVARLLIIKYLDYSLLASESHTDMNAKKTPNHNMQVLVQLRIINVIRKWVDNFTCDFDSDLSLTRLLLDFLLLEVNKDEKKVIFTKGLVDKLESIKKKFTEKSHFSKLNRLKKDPTDTKQLVKQYKKMTKKELEAEQVKRTIALKIPLATSFSCDEVEKILEKSILDIDEKMLAEQLTYAEAERFKSIKVEEFFHQRWNAPEAALIAPNLVTSIDWFNRIAFGFAGLIVSSVHSKTRLNIIKQLILIAQELLSLGNFNGLYQIMAALNMSPVARLKKTWASLPKKYAEMWRELSTLLSNEENHVNYRKRLRASMESRKLIIPYIGLALTDLTFAEDGNPTYRRRASGVSMGSREASQMSLSLSTNFATSSGLLGDVAPVEPPIQRDESEESEFVRSVNFTKFRLIGTLIRKLRTMQSVPYTIQPVPWVLVWISEKLPYFTEAQMFEMSLECEPRVREHATK